MLDIRVETPRREFTALLRVLEPSRVAFAEAQACNRTAANVQKTGIELVAKRMGIPQTKLAKRGRRTDWRGRRQHGAFARGRKATRRHLQASLRGVGRPFNVTRFNAVPIYAGSSTSLKTGKQRNPGKKKGRRVIGVAHNAWGRRQTAGPNVWRLKNGAFVIPSGNTFRGMFGPGVTHVLQYPSVEKKLVQVALERYPQHFSSAIEYAFSSDSHLR